MTITTKRRGSLARAEARQALGFASPALVGLALFTIVPVALSIVMSVYDWPTFGDRTFSGVENYAKLFTASPDFWPALRNSAVYTLLYVPLSIALSLVLAIGLGPRIRGRGALRVLFFIPVVVPMVANVLVWKMMLQPQGLFNGVAQSWFGVTLPNFLADPSWAMIMVVAMSVWQGLGINVIVFLAGLQAIPQEYYDAASVDGAGRWPRLRHVTLPLLTPSIFFTGILSLIGSFQVFDQVYILARPGKPTEATVTLVYFIYESGFKFFRMGEAAAASWILFLIVAVLTVVYFRSQRRWVHYQ